VATFKIHLFGRFNTHRDDRELDCFPSTKAKELFCYLLLYRDRPHTRETLATVFWGEFAPEQTRKYLRQTLWQLQHALHDLFKGDCLDIVRMDRAAIRLNDTNTSPGTSLLAGFTAARTATAFCFSMKRTRSLAKDLKFVTRMTATPTSRSRICCNKWKSTPG
jgi:DNA-binding SARP family transcriptional activator